VPLLLKVDTPASSLPIAETSRLDTLGAADLSRLCGLDFCFSRACRIVYSPIGLVHITHSGPLLLRFLHANSLPEFAEFRILDGVRAAGHVATESTGDRS